MAFVPSTNVEVPPPTSSVYTHLRQLISTVDNLRDVGLNQYIKLPRICVVGTQSAGKSSLLEAVVGIDFLPRGEGVVTRRPLEMRLVHLTSETDIKPYCVFDGTTERISDFQEVKSAIAKKTDEVAGNRKGIVDDPIMITIYGKEVPDLTLIDLPGITRVPLQNSDQTEDIETVTKDMVMRYASDVRTVILAVIPANQDISTSDALKIARTVDQKGIRTLGVITKIDLMDSGTDAARMLRGTDIPMRLGYIGVKLRSQQDINTGVTIADSLVHEHSYFSKHAVYRTLPPALIGTKTLTSKLAGVLFRHIKHCLPDIKSEITNRRTTVATRLTQLGMGPPQDDAERVQLIWSLVTDFCEILKNTIRGKFDRRLSAYFDDSEALAGGAEIRQIMNELLEEKLRIDMTAGITDYEIDRAVRQHEGDSLPGFPSPDTFEFLLLPHLSEIHQPVIDCLDRVSATLDAMAIFIITKIFHRFPSLGEKVTMLSSDILQEQKDFTKGILEKLIAAETGYLFTNDEEYLVNHAQMGKMLPATNTTSSSYHRQIPDHMQANVNDGQIEATGDPNSAGPYTMKGLHHMTSQLLQSTQTGVSNVVSSLKPDAMGLGHERTPLYSKEFLQEIRSRLNSYFRLVLKNTRETVPKTIGYFLVRSVQDILQYQLYQTLTKAENLDDLLGEPAEIRQERKELKDQREILEKATTVLQRDLGSGTGSFIGGFDEFFDRDIARSMNAPAGNPELQPTTESTAHQQTPISFPIPGNMSRGPIGMNPTGIPSQPSVPSNAGAYGDPYDAPRYQADPRSVINRMPTASTNATPNSVPSTKRKGLFG